LHQFVSIQQKGFLVNRESSYKISAYVNSKKSGVVLEKPLQQNRSYDGQSELDISEEIAFARAKLEELVCSSASEDTIRHAMKKIGTERSHLYIV
jgi:fatty acyl-CoA reductase